MSTYEEQLVQSYLASQIWGILDKGPDFLKIVEGLRTAGAYWSENDQVEKPTPKRYEVVLLRPNPKHLRHTDEMGHKFLPERYSHAEARQIADDLNLVWETLSE